MGERQYKHGIDRQQECLFPASIDEYVAKNNSVRAIDAYVNSLDLLQLEFKNTEVGVSRGQPAFPPGALLKLYLYGYLHQIRTSRRLEAECLRNLELIWLLEGLQPCYKTIANFRKDNLKALKQVNQDFVRLCKELDLFGAELVGIDGSFFRGNVAKSNIFTANRIQQMLKQIEQDIFKYLGELDQADQQEGESTQIDPALTEKLEQLRIRQQEHTEQLKQMEKEGATQVAKVDEDARLLSKKGKGTIAGYNVQTAVDSKNKLIVTCEVTQDGNDEQQLAPMAKAAKTILEVEKLTTVQDQGYFNAQQIKTCEENGITPYVPEPDKQAQTKQQGRFPRDQFSYDEAANCYRCPNDKILHFHGVVKKRGKNILHYRSSPTVCAACPLKSQCVSTKMRYRTVTRWEHEKIIEAHRQRMNKDGPEKMRQRAALCEHPFGTLKLWCGWRHFLLRGLDKVRAEMNLMMWSYNFKRVLNILGLEAFQAYCFARGSHKPLRI